MLFACSMYFLHDFNAQHALVSVFLPVYFPLSTHAHCENCCMCICLLILAENCNSSWCRKQAPQSCATLPFMEHKLVISDYYNSYSLTRDLRMLTEFMSELMSISVHTNGIVITE